MFKAAFPGATEEEEEREMRWVSHLWASFLPCITVRLIRSDDGAAFLHRPLDQVHVRYDWYERKQGRCDGQVGWTLDSACDRDQSCWWIQDGRMDQRESLSRGLHIF
jgi:hypothetical protein